MNNRLLQFLAAENINQSQFADSIGVARASVSHILAGRNKPGYDFIENTMKRFPALNIEWLLTGRGRMYKTDEPEQPAAVIPGLSEPQNASPAPMDSPFRTALKADFPHSTGRKIAKILVFYDDNTYQELS